MTPELRFPGFEGEWAERTLGKVFSFRNGFNTDKSAYGRGRKFINVMDLIEPEPIIYGAIKGCVDISDADLALFDVRYGDVLFQRSSETREEVGQSNVYVDRDQPAAFGGFVIRGRPVEKIEPTFYASLLRTDPVRKDMTSRSGGSTRYNIGQESLAAVPVVVPATLAEQREIAAFLDAVEERIALAERRRDGLVDYKRGLMQALFSRRLRFRRDDGTAFPEWGTVRLSDIGSFFGGLTGKTKDDFGDGAPFVTYGQVFRGPRFSIEDCGRVRVGKDEKQNALREGDALFTGSSEVAEEVGMTAVFPKTDEEVFLNSFCIAFRPKNSKEILSDFSMYLFRSPEYRRKVFPLAQGSTRFNLSRQELGNLELQLPYPGEQRKIADALSALDDRIAAATARLDALKEWRRGLLQKMFVR